MAALRQSPRPTVRRSQCRATSGVWERVIPAKAATPLCSAGAQPGWPGILSAWRGAGAAALRRWATKERPRAPSVRKAVTGDKWQVHRPTEELRSKKSGECNDGTLSGTALWAPGIRRAQQNVYKCQPFLLSDIYVWGAKPLYSHGLSRARAFRRGRQGEYRSQMWRETRGRAINRRANRILGRFQGGAQRLIRYVMLT